MRFLSGFFWIAGLLTAQLINYRGIVNGASFVPLGLPGSEIARGSVFSIFGNGLGPTTLTRVSSFPLGTTLAGVSIKVFQGKSSVDAFPLIVSAGQINAIMPSNAPLGRVSIQVTINGVAGNLSPATVTASSFGIFTANSSGFGPGIVNNFISQSNQPINSLSQSAAPGQVVTLWGTGLGAVHADNTAPSPGNLPTPVEIFVGGVAATKQYSGRSPCCAGVDQIVFTIPDNAPLGCYVPIQIRTEGARMSNTATLAIQRTGGGTCSDPLNPIAAAFRKGGKVGVAVLVRSTDYVDVDIPPPATETTEDYAGVALRANPAPSDFFFNPTVSLPPIGACATYGRVGAASAADEPDSFGTLGAEMDAGANISIAGRSTTTIAPVPFTAYYADLLGSSDSTLGLPLVINDTGSTAVYAPGGTDVGTFKVNIPAAAPIDWTNRLQIELIDRSKPLDMAWSSDAVKDDLIAVIGWEYDQPSNASWTFVCSAAGSSGKFTVPAYILSALPPSRPLVGQSYGGLELKSFAAQALTKFEASGLDAGYGFEIVSTKKTVLFK